MNDLAGRKVAYVGFTGAIDDDGATRICGTFNAAVNNGYDEVYMTLNTLGGFVGTGVFIYNHIRALPIEVTIHNTGSVASIGVAVFAAASRRFCAPTSTFMIHPVAAGISGQHQLEPLQATLQAIVQDEERIDSILRERFSLTDDVLSKRRFTDVYLSPQQALDFGLVQSVCTFQLPPGNQIVMI